MFPSKNTSHLQVYSDASGWFGCETIEPSEEWFQLEWPSSWIAAEIATKEEVLAECMCGKDWCGWYIGFHSKNTAIVERLLTQSLAITCSPPFFHSTGLSMADTLSTCRALCLSHTQLGFQALDTVVHGFLIQSLSSATLASYWSAISCFLSFCCWFKVTAPSPLRANWAASLPSYHPPSLVLLPLHLERKGLVTFQPIPHSYRLQKYNELNLNFISNNDVLAILGKYFGKSLSHTCQHEACMLKNSMHQNHDITDNNQ